MRGRKIAVEEGFKLLDKTNNTPMDIPQNGTGTAHFKYELWQAGLILLASLSIWVGRLIGFKVEVPMVSVIRVLPERLSARVTNKNGLIFA